MRLMLFLLTACAETHPFVPAVLDAGGIDAGTDAGMDAPAPCEAPFVEDGEYCVAWLPAAPLPVEADAELVQLAWSGDFVVRQGEAIHRYDVENDGWIPEEGTAIPYEI